MYALFFSFVVIQLVSSFFPTILGWEPFKRKYVIYCCSKAALINCFIQKVSFNTQKRLNSCEGNIAYLLKGNVYLLNYVLSFHL